MENLKDLQEKSELISNFIRSSSRIIYERGHRIAEEYGLTYDEYHILIFLIKRTEAPSINELSKRFNRAQNTISEKISRLEGKKLVEKFDDELDRRITRIIITSKGKELIGTIREERNIKIVYNALESIDEKQVDNLLKNLNKLYENLKEED